jgi:phage-related protein
MCELLNDISKKLTAIKCQVAKPLWNMTIYDNVHELIKFLRLLNNINDVQVEKLMINITSNNWIDDMIQKIEQTKSNIINPEHNEKKIIFQKALNNINQKIEENSDKYVKEIRIKYVKKIIEDAKKIIKNTTDNIYWLNHDGSYMDDVKISYCCKNSPYKVELLCSFLNISARQLHVSEYVEIHEINHENKTHETKHIGKIKLKIEHLKIRHVKDMTNICRSFGHTWKQLIFCPLKNE